MPGETIDFGALAARLADIDGVRVCLLMSRDGLTLGVHPADREEAARAVWERMHSIGDPERGFLTVGDELWIVTRRGPYAGIVVAGPSATPGLLLDRLEFSLRAAEELRLREGSAAAAPRTEGSRKPRTPLHPEIELVPHSAPSLEPEGEVAADAVSAAIQIASMREGTLTRRPSDPAPGGNGNGNGSAVREAAELKLRPLETEAAPQVDPQPEPKPEPKPEVEPVPEPEPEPEVEIEIRPVPDDEVHAEIEIEIEPGEDPASEPAERPFFPARGDEREVDPVALAREFKNLFDRPDD
ncbi:MAG TPA: hypothetical protein VMP42_02715 [Actinomycetota bacterium]|nr:hypothetical protein [Actinomycetota bacterium]